MDNARSSIVKVIARIGKFFMFYFSNLLAPPILFFGLGFLICLMKSDLKFSSGFINGLSAYLIIGIGLHGGVMLRNAQLEMAFMSILVALILGVALSFIAYFAFLYLGGFDKFNSSAVAAHYGSVSLGTFLTAIAFLTDQNIPYEGYPTIMLAVMEVPSIIIGIILAKIARKRTDSHLLNTEQNNSLQERTIVREVFTSGSIMLLIGSIVIGYIAQIKGIQALDPFFGDIFNGVLCLFLVCMGIEAAKRIHEVYKMGLFLLAFGVFMPIVGGLLGIILGKFVLGFEVGGMTLVAVLGASASYIAAPAVIKKAIPEANPTLYLTLALGITFPFNVTLGIPLYYKISQLLVTFY